LHEFLKQLPAAAGVPVEIGDLAIGRGKFAHEVNTVGLMF
jgi:hypothetical protein